MQDSDLVGKGRVHRSYSPKRRGGQHSTLGKGSRVPGAWKTQGDEFRNRRGGRAGPAKEASRG